MTIAERHGLLSQFVVLLAAGRLVPIEDIKIEKGSADLTADGVRPSPSNSATAVQVGADGFSFAAETAKSSIVRSLSAFHW